jgi:hypothetical protein
MIRPEHPFDIRPDLRKAASTKAESTTAESVIRPKQLVRANMRQVLPVQGRIQDFKLGGRAHLKK